MSKSIYNHWLPEPLAEQVATEEPRRYAALVASLKEQWERDRRRLPLPEAVRATQGFLAPCRTFYHARADLPPASLLDLVRTQLSIVLLGEGDLMVQTRWALQAQQLLRTHRSKLRGLRVAWRPWLLTLRRAVLRDAARDYEGSALSEARRQTLARLAHRLRRHWPRGAAAEIWAALRPALLDAQRPAAYEALGWLVMLLPTTALRAGDGDWGAWAREWARLWGEQAHCAYWDALWGALFARLAAHDAFGLVDWRALAPALLSRYAWAFRVPVGASFADPPLSFDSPRHCQVLFANELQNRAECAAHAAVYMIGHVAGGDGVSEEQARSGGLNGVDGSFQKKSPPQDPAASPYGDLLKPAQTDDDPALALLERLVAVLEQYYHPSNGGRWTPGLAHFLRALTGAFAGRVLSESRQRRRAALREAAVGGARAGRGARPLPRADDAAEKEEAAREEDDVDMEEEDEEEDALSADEAAAAEGSGSDSSEEEEALPTPPGGRRRAPLSEPAIARVAALLLRLAEKAQFGKDRELRRGATRVLGQLAEIAPAPTLAAVHAHFCAALETVVSTHVLAGAIQSLTLCVRPMLLAGLRLRDDGAVDERPPPRAAAGAALAAALVATLPAIDANDPSKSLAAFRFYAVALSSLAGLPEHPTSGFPFETELWVEELLSRVFAALGNLDSPEHHHASDGATEGAAGGGNAAGNDGDETFLLDSASMFRPLMELLFSRLPAPLRRHAVQRVARFLLENTLTSVTAEASVLCNAIVWADPALALERALAPALRALREDALAAAAEPARELSRAQEGALCWRVNLVSSLVTYAGADVLAHRAPLLEALDLLRALTQPSVAEATQGLVSSLLVCLVQRYPLGEFAPVEAGSGERAPKDPSSSSTSDAWAMRLAEGVPCVTLPDSGIELETFLEASVPEGARWATPLRPRWHEPDAAELAFAAQVLRVSLEEPVALLEGMTRDGSLLVAAAAGAGARARDGLRAALYLAQGAAAGASTCLPPLVLGVGEQEETVNGSGMSTNDKTPATTTAADVPLTLVGELGATVGSRALRRRAAAATLSALRALQETDADPDTVYLLLSVADSFFAAGSLEHADSLDHASSWAADERWAAERALTGRLLPTAAATARRWTRRRPRWLAVEKTFVSLRWRASQAVYRAGATARAPRAPLEAVPELYLDYVRALVHHTLHGYVGTRALAVYNLERALKAYPVLTEGAAAPLLRAMAGLEPGAAGAGPDGWRRAAAGALPDLRDAVERAGERAAAAGAEPQSEAEEALAVGMPRLLGSGRSFWRLASGPDWAPLRALIASLLASAVHGGAGAQAEILGAAVTLGFRHVRPVVEDGPAVSQLVGDLVRCCLPVALGEGGMSDGLGDDEGVLGDKDALAAPAAMPWRYSLLAAALLGMLYESAPPESAARAAALQLRLLGSDLLLLRQAAIAPVLKGLLPVWKGAAYCAAQGADADGAVIVRAVRRGLANAGESCAGEASGATDALDSSLASLSASSEQLLLQNVDPPSVPSPPTADIAEAVRAALERGGAPLVRLIFARLAGNHAALAGGGAEADGGAPAGPQIGSTDEVIVRLVSSSLLRFALWPSGRERVGPLKDGAFKPEHAALAQALTAVAPELVLGALRDPLRAALEAAAQDADRQSTAAAAEALAGVLASGQALLVEAEGHDGAAPSRTAWEAWVRPLLRQALRRAPLDLVPQWAAGVLRYATYELATAGKLDALAQLCALVAEPAQEAEARGAEAGAAQAMVASASSPALVGAIGGGAVPAARSPPRAGHAAPSPAASPSPRPPAPGLPAAPPTTSAHFRRLTYVYHVLTEAVTVLGNREQPGFLLELWERLLLEAPGYASLPGQMVRTASSRLAALLISNALDCAALAASDQGSFVDAHASDSGRSVPQRREQLAWQCMGALASSFADSVAILAEDGGRFRRSSSSADVAAEDGESLADGAARGVARRLRLSRSQAAFGDADVVMGTAEDENEEEEATKADAGPETLAPEGDDVDLGEAAPRSESFDGSSAPGDEEGDDGSTRSRAGASPALSEGYLDPEPSPGSAVLMQSNAAVLGGVPRGPAAAPGPSHARAQAAIQHVAYCVEFASQVLQRGQAGALRRELARMLPGLLRIQRLIPSELQSVCLSARRALALLKYLPLAGDAEAVSLTLRALREACRSDIWTERAAALVYLQYFWFRHVLVLAHEGGTAALVGVVVERLADAKLEIRDLAAATLSGLIKGLDEREAAALRQSFLADAERLLPAKRRRPRGGAPAASPAPAPAPASLARRHAAVQGLRAFVLSAPYDVPDWLPEVLMALVRVAGEAGPVRTTVTKTLAEFRRTHEEAGLAEARDRLTSDQWEAIRDVANPAPYFV